MKRISLRSFVSLGIALSLCSPTACSIRTFAQTAGPAKYKLAPSEGRAGQTYDVIVMSTKPDCESKKELSEAQLIIPQGVTIDLLGPSTKAPCTLTTRIRVGENAPVSKFTLWVGKENQSPIALVEFSVVDSTPAGAIPPGVNPPAVDVMWSVMPRQIVQDNFGRPIAKRYYAVEIILGNNSAYTLQLVSVGFELPSDRTLQGLIARNTYNRQIKSASSEEIRSLVTKRDAAITEILKNPGEDIETRKTLLPTSSYKITRGSLEARQLTDPRTLVLSTITALGPIFTGFTPYFHNVNHKANFSEFINIFSNPLEKGLELVWPDKRPRQRERFDDQVLRDGLIIRNNTQVRTLAFFPKELLKLPRDVESPQEYDRWSNNAREIRERLGNLIIIGDLIQYVNRISLIPNAPGPVAAPAIAFGITPNSIKQGKQGNFTITGSNFQGAQLIPSDPGIHAENIQIDPTGHTITSSIRVDDTVAPGTYRIVVATPSSLAGESVTVLVEPENFVVTGDLVYEKKKPGNDVIVEVKGTYLHNARIRVLSTPADSIRVVSLDRASNGKSLTATFNVSANTTPGVHKVEIFDETNPSSTPVKKDFEVKAP